MCTNRNQFVWDVFDKIFLTTGPNPYIRDTLFLLAIGVLTITLASCGSPEKRIALVIGNQYKNSEKLNLESMPAIDAKKIADALKHSKFDFINAELIGLDRDERNELLNLDLDEMHLATAEFKKQAADADVVFFYFSGHF